MKGARVFSERDVSLGRVNKNGIEDLTTFRVVTTILGALSVILGLRYFGFRRSRPREARPIPSPENDKKIL